MKPQYVEICVSLNLYSLTKLPKAELVEVLKGHCALILSQKFTFDPAEFFYCSKVRDLTRFVELGFNIQVNQNQFTSLFLSFFSN